MTEFDLDLSTIEAEIDDTQDRSVILGVLDGTTSGEEWIRAVVQGNILVLSIDGTLTDLASDFAPEIRDGGGSIVHFRDFLIVSPSDVGINTDRL